MNSLVTRTVLYVLVLVIAITALPLVAQDTQKTAEEEKKQKVTEEMVVTARKREEAVQDIPMSVAAPTESELRDRGADRPAVDAAIAVNADLVEDDVYHAVRDLDHGLPPRPTTNAHPKESA